MYVKSKVIILLFKIIITQAFITLAFLNSCECPPNLNTNKEIIPTEFSNIAIINLIPYEKPFDVYSQKIPIANNIDCITNSEFKYYKFPANYANLMVKQSNEIVFNTMIFSLPGHYLTIFFYNQENTTQFAVVEDDYIDSLSNAYLRLCNFSTNMKLKYEIASSLPQPIILLMNSNDISKMIPMPAGKISIKVINLENNQQISSISDIQLQINSITNIITIGDTNNNQTNLKRTFKNKN